MYHMICNQISRRITVTLDDSGGLEVRFLKLARGEGWIFDTHPTLGRTLLVEVDGPDSTAPMVLPAEEQLHGGRRDRRRKKKEMETGGGGGGGGGDSEAREVSETAREDSAAIDAVAAPPLTAAERLEARRRRHREDRVREMRRAIADFRAADDGTGFVRLDALDAVVRKLAQVCADAGLESLHTADLLHRFGTAEGHLARSGYLRLHKHVWAVEDAGRYIGLFYAMLDGIRDSDRAEPLSGLFDGAISAAKQKQEKQKMSEAEEEGEVAAEFAREEELTHHISIDEVAEVLEVDVEGKVLEGTIENAIRKLLERRVRLLESCTTAAASAAPAGDVPSAEASAAVGEDLFDDWEAGMYGANTVYIGGASDAI